MLVFPQKFSVYSKKDKIQNLNCCVKNIFIGNDLLENYWNISRYSEVHIIFLKEINMCKLRKKKPIGTERSLHGLIVYLDLK